MGQQTHEGHSHKHGAGCGHRAVEHESHTDYLHDGHLHHDERDRVIECLLKEDAANPGACTPQHACGEHDATHVHGAGCGHEPVPHAGHTDYWVGGHLHHPHGDHCDHHGAVQGA